MAGTFETIDADGIDAGAFGTQCVADGDTLVDDPDAGAFQSGPMIRRFRTRGFNKLDAAFDDGIDVLGVRRRRDRRKHRHVDAERLVGHRTTRSEEHTSELQSLMRISYAVFCLKKNKYKH